MKNHSRVQKINRKPNLVYVATAKHVPRMSVLLVSLEPHSLSSWSNSSFDFWSATRSAFASSGFTRNSRDFAATSIAAKASAAIPLATALQIFECKNVSIVPKHASKVGRRWVGALVGGFNHCR